MTTLLEACARACRDARNIGGMATLSETDRRIARAVIPIVLEKAQQVCRDVAQGKIEYNESLCAEYNCAEAILALAPETQV